MRSFGGLRAGFQGVVMALVLVLDDERDACQLMARIISSFGHEVKAFTDSEEALKWVTRVEPDLALLDVGLRGSYGIDVVDRFLRIRPKLKAILITGYPSMATAGEAFHSGTLDLLVKPVELDELEARVRLALGLIK
ncbi:response regulator receiver protein [Syntrophobacter fumaroxidans MPOB]|uniref:Response regulator receiver protein n=2 Tax=Syntrophobacter TaxID=29526 RepID=A0LNF9_SYNFM|nr:response regulator receiver protein [Syntrophobacter fumaroxidans MPOB]